MPLTLQTRFPLLNSVNEGLKPSSRSSIVEETPLLQLHHFRTVCPNFGTFNCVRLEKRFARSFARAKMEYFSEQIHKMWGAAEQMQIRARGFGKGDPDTIQEIMNRYRSHYFSQNPNETELEVEGRYKKMLEMMQALASHWEAWPQFQNGHCQEIKRTEDRCRDHESGHEITIQYQCDFGITREEKQDNCEPIGRYGN